MYSMSSCGSLEMAAFAARFPRPGEGCEKDSVTAKNHVLDSRHGRDLKGNARLERAYPEDFRARRSPTANVSADVIARDGNGLPEQRRCVGDRLRDGRVDAGPHHALPGRTHGDVAFGVPGLLP